MANFKHALLFAILGITSTNGKAVQPKPFQANSPKLRENVFSYVQAATEEDIIKQDSKFWLEKGQNQLKRQIKLEEQRNTQRKAKNVIIFIGDGMGISTITAARIFKGQSLGYSGEEYELFMESFPNVGLVKTYNVDMQVPDSAGTATAMFSGVKARYEALGIDARSNKSFNEATYETSKVTSMMTWAQDAKKSTGIITTTRITHATPGATYAHINHRDWECDSELPEEYRNSTLKDIARQLVEDEPGRNLNVILGGGLDYLGYNFSEGVSCLRSDGKNLTQYWLDSRPSGTNVKFVTNSEGLNSVDDNTDYLLGLFAGSHMPYALSRNKGPKGQPSLLEMTKKAVQILKKNPNGFVLMVEGGLIDRAHHKNYARHALFETSEFDDTVKYVTNEFGDDTSILVTADHSHAFTMNGYSKRGNDILGYTIQNDADDFHPYLTLAYGNGPGFSYHYTPENASNITYPWRDAREDQNRLNDPYYQHLGSFYADDETHGGEDVALFARGPNSHLIRGVVEQNLIGHFISYTACIGPSASMNPACSGAAVLYINIILLFVTLFNMIW